MTEDARTASEDGHPTCLSPDDARQTRAAVGRKLGVAASTVGRGVTEPWAPWPLAGAEPAAPGLM